MSTSKQGIIRKSLGTFLFLAAMTGVVLGTGGYALFRSLDREYMGNLKKREARTIEQGNAQAHSTLEAIADDVLFLARQNELIRFLDTGDAGLLPEIQKEYIRLADLKPIYDHIRFIDSTGTEVVRINNPENAAYAVEAGDLQNKRDRYYFHDCIKLDRDVVYASPMDLTVDKDMVEFPFNPTIRLGTPVFDTRGNKRGFVLINYKAKDLLDLIENLGRNSLGRPMLLNADGYWLLGHDEGRSWGFMFKDLKEDTFSRTYPEEWGHIQAMGAGYFSSDNGLYSFATIHPLHQVPRHKHMFNHIEADNQYPDHIDRYYWLLLSHISPETLQEHSKVLGHRLLTLGSALYLFMLGGAWHLSVTITRRRLYQSQLVTWAMHDPLTGLPNRKLFYDTLGTGIASSTRHGRPLALLYIDLDGFKAVNDTHGHEAGDDLLIQVGERMSKLLRQTDTVARLGGDEFAVILPETRDKAALEVGKRIIWAISRPFPLSADSVAIGASIGIAICPTHGTTEDALIQQADHAMYLSKKAGKNRCTLAEGETDSAE